MTTAYNTCMVFSQNLGRLKNLCNTFHIVRISFFGIEIAIGIGIDPISRRFLSHRTTYYFDSDSDSDLDNPNG